MNNLDERLCLLPYQDALRHKSIEGQIQLDSYVRGLLTSVVTRDDRHRQDSHPRFHRHLGTRLKTSVLSVVANWTDNAIDKLPDLETNESRKAQKRNYTAVRGCFTSW
jgi:hypothetical protein